MANSPLNRLNAHVSEMFASGMLDEHFSQLQNLHQEPNTPDFVSEIITTFCSDSDRILDQLTDLLEMPTVEFDKVTALVHLLKGSSSSVGARKVTSACVELRTLCKQKNKDACLRALAAGKSDFYELRAKFQRMVTLRRQVYGRFP